ncbi:MAG: single-stranded DNA-binding protein [Bacteroidales bacterium]|nr:single-stranded DNA-binding protein [Bacteroidales bacterium]
MRKIEVIGYVGTVTESDLKEKRKALNFNLCVNLVNEKKQWFENTIYFDSENEPAHIKHIKPGCLVYVSGIPEVYAYTNKANETKAVLKIICKDCYICKFVDDKP